MTKNGLVLIWVVLLFSGIAFLFWRNEWKYLQPTPVPANYHGITPGSQVSLPPSITATLAGPSSPSPLLAASYPKPLFLHFFNPDCPCSRFNMPQFKALVQRYGQQASFAIVVLSPKKFTATELQKKFNLSYPIPVVRDSAVAAACGVYSTPQAVIINTDGRLFYRGNYNKSRYCSDEKTGFARLALDSLLGRKVSDITYNYSPTFSPLALKAYGCQLPSCTQ